MNKKEVCRLTFACGLILSSQAGFAQSTAQSNKADVVQTYTRGSIQGVVTDRNGDTLPGASVYVKGNAKSGTVTDINGKFAIKAKTGDVLVVSYVGFDQLEVKVPASEGALTVVLHDGANSLDQVVVVGYGVQKKSVLSSAVSRITSEDLDLGHPTNVQNALKGKVSGVQITSNSGQPGADSKIRIRGTGTVNDSDPLYIVDGLPAESGINNLNPSDIESIEILKDAASAAIYGARGANGVVLVTTKKGAKGKTKFNYEFTYGIQNPSKKLDLLGSADYQMLMNEMASNSGKAPYFATPSTVNTDWQKVLQNKNAPIMNHKFTLSGGTDNSTYYASFGYIKQEGIFAKGYSDYERYNARLNYSNTLLDTKRRNWLNKVVFGAVTSYSKSIQNGSSIGNSEVGGLMASIDMLPPTEPVYQTDADVLAQYDITYPNHVVAPNGKVYNIIEMREICNPLADMQVNHNERTMPQNFGGNFSLDVYVLPGLKFRTTYGTEWVFNSIKSVTPVYDLNATNKNTTSTIIDRKRQSSFWQWENVLNYTHSFGLHNIGAMAGTSMSSYHYENLEGQDYDLLATSLKKGYIDTATAAEEMSKVWGGASDHKMASVFFRFNYNYDERYLLEAVVRRDGSSNFSSKHQYATFPSVSAGWVFTREKFMKSTNSWLNFGKLRLSWGQNGNERIGAFAYTSMMSQGHNAVVDGKVYSGMLPAGYANKDLKWETSEQTDLGLDLRFFDNALTFSVDYFKKKTKDMLLYMPIPLYTSYGGMTVNGGTVENQGVEFEASYRFGIGQAHFGLSGNASWLRNKVTNQGPDRMAINNITGGMGGAVTYSENGRPYGFFYGYKTDGIFQNWDEVNNYKTADGTLKQPNAQPGDLRFKDLDGKNGIDANDRTMIGNPNPDWTYGFTLNADWKNFDFSAFFQGSIGNDIYKLYRRSNVALGNFEKKWLNRWYGEGTSNTVPRIVEGDNNNYQISDFFVEDGSYMRLKVLQIGYTLPKQMLNKIGIDNIRLYLQGENLFTVTNYTGYDPEVGTRNGLDSGTYPQARTFTFGVNVSF